MVAGTGCLRIDCPYSPSIFEKMEGVLNDEEAKAVSARWDLAWQVRREKNLEINGKYKFIIEFYFPNYPQFFIEYRDRGINRIYNHYWGLRGFPMVFAILYDPSDIGNVLFRFIFDQNNVFNNENDEEEEK